MLKTVAGTAALLCFCVAVPRVVRAQAVVETSLGVARAVTTTAPAARGIGGSMAGAWGALGNAMKVAGETVESSTAAPAAATAKKADARNAAPPKPLPVYEDAGHIRAGIAYDDLIRRFGPPAVEVNGATRSLDYAGKENTVHVEVADGKVISATTAKREQASVTLPGK